MRLFALLALALLGCRSAPGPLVVGSDLDNRPFAFVDKSGAARGRDVEMMEHLAQALGRELRWDRRPFSELLPAVERGEVDLVCATLGITRERARRVAFSAPYFETRLAVIVRAGPGEPTGLGGLAGRSVHAARGTTSEQAVLRELPKARLVPASKEGTTTAAGLLAGEFDAAVMDAPAALATVAAAAGGLRLLDEGLGSERYALALPLDRTGLLAELDRALGELRSSGVLASLDRRHGLAQVRP